MNLSDIIIAEGDTGIAVFHCGACRRQFRAEISRVTTANKQLLCLSCIEEANPKRIALGMPAIPFCRESYK
jgi:hypothetical protein